ncbi:YybH family protein [Pseudonocardia sp. TRM90224]|uniref:YybH family protein n=1 Tax=Pseudonocardia sp. TRM90224 TaxID=2812678 RepID=UPI001E283CC5|nr:nuclear transport factor 2 family protein [Pseudonocardia sp. TRM90224]
MTTFHDAPADPAQVPIYYADLFNAGDLEALESAFEPDAVMIPQPGQPTIGDARRAALRHLAGFGLPMKARTRHTYICGDIALLVVDWSMNGPTPGGYNIDLSGTATDVVRRGPDGRWRYVIDNPFGGATG